MGDEGQWINHTSREKVAPSLLREIDVWTLPGPTGPTNPTTIPDIENTASTTHLDTSLRPHTLDSTPSVRVTASEKTPQNSEPHVPSSSSGDNDSTIGISIRLNKRQPTEDVIVLRIENHVYLDIALPFQSPVTWNAIQIPHTTSVKRVDIPNDDDNTIPLMLEMIVRGATTGQEYVCVCDQCEERVGQRLGRPSLIDFYSPSNIIRPKNGTVHIHFTFCCYSRHHLKEDNQYVLEVVLKDPKDPSGPRVVATKKIPYYFDVTARSLPRNKKRTNAEAEHDNIGPSRKRRRTKSLSPATTFTTQLEVVPQQEGIEPQMPQGRMVGELWSIMDYPQRQQQGLNDAQNLLPADAVPHLPSTPLPHIRSSGSAGGAEIWLFGADLPENLMPFARDASVPETVRHILVADASPASGPCAQSLFTGVAGGNARDEPTCDVQIRAHALDRAWEDIPGQQGFNSLSFAPIRRLSVEPHSLSVEPLRIPTDTEIVCTRAIVPEREARVHALQAKIRDLRTRFETDNQEKPDALQLITDHMHSQIFGIQNEMKDYWNAFLTKPLEAEAEVNQEEIATLLSVMNQLSDRIVAIQKEIADRRNAFSAERREAEAAVAAKIMIYIMEHENYNSASFLAPIQRLPVEILAEIFLLSRNYHLRPPLHLMHVCRRWRATMLNTPRIWVNLRLRTWTKMDEVRFALERTGASPLDVEIDTGMDVFKMVDTDKLKWYAGLELATTEAKRWRNLTITSFPTQLDIDTHYKPEKPVFSGPMNALQSFKLKSICEDSVIFDQLLNVMGSSSHEKLTDMELSSPNAIYRLAQPQFASIFRRLVTFKVDVREMQEEVDILPQFEQLVTLEAYRLRLPNYPVETDLPLVRTLKYMKIKLVSVQWMSGRTFPNMMECTLISPHNPQTLAPGVGVDLPECTDFTYDDFFIDVLPNFCIPKLDTLVIRNNVLNNPRGSSQLADFWSRVAGVVASLMPRVLHLDTQRHDRHLVDAPSMLPELEGLTAPLRRPPSSGSAATSVGRTCG